MALAERLLAGTRQELDDSIIRDCVGEIANVIAGQLKALLASTRCSFTMSLPQTVGASGPHPMSPSSECLVVLFSSELGEFSIQFAVEI